MFRSKKTRRGQKAKNSVCSPETPSHAPRDLKCPSVCNVQQMPPTLEKGAALRWGRLVCDFDRLGMPGFASEIEAKCEALSG